MIPHNRPWITSGDKKAVDGFTFVLDGPNGLEIVKGIEEILIKETLKKVR